MTLGTNPHSPKKNQSQDLTSVQAVQDDFCVLQVSVASSCIEADASSDIQEEAMAPAHGDAAANAFELPMPGSDSNWLEDSQVPPTP